MLTQAQKDAAERVIQILSEHFDACVVVVSANDDEERRNFTEVMWHGGFPTAFGLIEMGKIRLWERRFGETPRPQ
jgi:hypothetical protein